MGAISSSSVRIPAFARWAAIAAPMVPAPSTAAFSILYAIDLLPSKVDRRRTTVDRQLIEFLPAVAQDPPGNDQAVDLPSPFVQVIDLAIPEPLLQQVFA